MYINKIKLLNFRNYEEQELELNKNINIFYGDNAQGKTNIIESIFLCSIGKSYRTNKDRELINFNKDSSSAFVEYQKSDRSGSVKIDLGSKKNIFVNGVKIKKLSELLGNLNIVIFTPDDILILKEGPDKRRRFLDVMISQLRPNYVHFLNLYKQTLEQRNNYLKQIRDYNKPEEMLEIWDIKLAEYGEKIFLYRNEFIEKLKTKIGKVHSEITENGEDISIEYISDCVTKNNFLELLNKRRKLDIIKGFTTRGAHRDDFNIYINNDLVNVYGSQGQNRTAILSLKISEMQVIYDEIGEYPILLLDDFMSELDSKRRKNFLDNIQNMQVIITCTDKIGDLNRDYKLFNVKKGKIL